MDKHGDPVLTSGPRGSWDERGVADPYVIRVGSMYMYYLGQDRARRQRIGVARSADGVQLGETRDPILCWNSVSRALSMRLGSASRPCGRSRARTGCFIRLAIRRSIGGSAWRGRRMAFDGSG